MEKAIKKIVRKLYSMPVEKQAIISLSLLLAACVIHDIGTGPLAPAAAALLALDGFGVAVISLVKKYK